MEKINESFSDRIKRAEAEPDMGKAYQIMFDDSVTADLKTELDKDVKKEGLIILSSIILTKVVYAVLVIIAVLIVLAILKWSWLTLFN